MRTIEIPELGLVAMIGASGSGKSTLARRHFLPTEVLSSDFFRGLVSTMRTTRHPHRMHSARCTTFSRSGSHVVD